MTQPHLVLKGAPVDALAPSAIAPLKITALEHELRDDAVEDGPLVM